MTFLLLACPVRALDTTGFSIVQSPHFKLYHQAALAPAGLMVELERIHTRLRMDLSKFAPWMFKERVKVILYSSRENYLASEFRPAPWSRGVSLHAQRFVATHEESTREQLLEALSNQLSILFLESYWGEVRGKPPAWLSYGLGALGETDPKDAQNSIWYKAMSTLSEGRSFPLNEFFLLDPAADLKDSGAVARWNVQSYSLVYFLCRRHSRQQFQNFCRQLRGGKELREALWIVYRYPGIEKFETAWLEWLRLSDSARPRIEWRGP